MRPLFDTLVKKVKDNHGTWHYYCPLGLWWVVGADKLGVSSEARVYFYQYLEDGEYDGLIAKETS